ncbi:unnamed protein product [Oikopleura dioica]|uniref:Uncharacterized protein n=1 Tax=Oikopleura dioica TaxID=34765 RepID=E4YW53_OIKDI|nr:unnamed protein product [Oikopleura dioica]
MSEKDEQGLQNQAYEKTAEENALDDLVEEAKEVAESHRESENELENEDENEKKQGCKKRSKRASKNAIHPSLQNKQPKDDESEISSGNESDSGSERDISDSSDDDEPEISLVGSEMSKKEALKALHEFIDGHCCWGRRPAKNLEVKSVTSSTAYKYQIASYTETRRVVKRHRPYSGLFIFSILK